MYLNGKRFRPVIMEAVDEGLISPDVMEFDYDSFIAYRGVSKRKDDPEKKICIEDFLSYRELNRRCDKYALTSYGCSLFTDYEHLDEAYLRFPPRRDDMVKLAAKGVVSKEYGTVKHGENCHVDLFLYEDAEPEKEFTYV